MKHWLIKSEPSTFSIDDLKSSKTTSWDGVRNYQARNFMRDEMQVGDPILFYHSNGNPSGIAGIAKVCKTAHPDITALDPKSPYFDPRSTQENPIWMLVDVAFVKKNPRLISLGELKTHPELKEMLLLKKGTRLSIQPVTSAEFQFITTLC